MSVATSMTMTAAVYRNAQTATDDYGHAKPNDWALVDNIACFLWMSSSRLTRTLEREAQVDVPMLMVPRNSDIKVGDRVLSVVDRMGTVKLGASMVEAVSDKHSHMSVALKRAET
jgi:hypothetical protein